jgi:hypothetical protein
LDTTDIVEGARVEVFISVAMLAMSSDFLQSLPFTRY